MPMLLASVPRTKISHRWGNEDSLGQSKLQLTEGIIHFFSPHKRTGSGTLMQGYYQWFIDSTEIVQRNSSPCLPAPEDNCLQ